MSWSGFYCLHLDAAGRPCNRRTMRPLSECSAHREASPQKRDAEAQRAAQARYRERQRIAREGAGLSVAMEGA